MAARNCKDDDIEDILRRLEACELSEDECESDGDDLDFYPSREDLLQVLEDEPTDDVNNSDSPNSNNNSTSNDNQSTVSGSNQHIPASTPISNRQLIWKKQSFQFNENKILFDGNTAYLSEVTSLETPYQFFSYFFTDQIFEHIVQESNRYSIQKNPARPESITTTELRQYLGILTFMSVFRYPNIRSYWSTKFGFAPISETMSLNRFEKIRGFIHFNDNDKHLPTSHINHDRLDKLRPIIDHLNNRFGSFPYEQRLSVDEQMCATKIGHFLKQYLPNKPHKWGFKLFVMCCLQGFAYQFEIYSGKMTHERLPAEPELGVVSDTVIRLTRGVPRNRNHIIYFDNYYTNLPLMHYFAQQGIYCLGTVQRNRLGKNCKLPTKSEVMKQSVPRGHYEENVSNYEGTEVAAVSWKDNKPVTLLSTYVGARVPNFFYEKRSILRLEK